MKCIIAGGTGFIGQALVKHWLTQGHKLTVLGRDKQKIQDLFSNTVTAIDWQDFAAKSDSLLKDVDIIVNLCGANIGAKRWTAERKREILDSRTTPTTAIAKACAKLGEASPRLFNASAIGTYGLQMQQPSDLPPALDESADTDAEPSDFLSTVGRTWEAATSVAEQAGVKVTKLRFGVVLAKHGGALPQIAMPFRLFIGGRIASGQQAMTWIALSDLIRAIDFLVEHAEVVGPINLVAVKAVSQREFAKSLGKALKRPSFIPTSGFILRLLFGDMAKELLLEGQHVVPTRLSELGFEFQHPDLDSALAAIYNLG